MPRPAAVHLTSSLYSYEYSENVDEAWLPKDGVATVTYADDQPAAAGAARGAAGTPRPRPEGRARRSGPRNARARGCGRGGIERAPHPPLGVRPQPALLDRRNMPLDGRAAVHS